MYSVRKVEKPVGRAQLACVRSSHVKYVRESVMCSVVKKDSRARAGATMRFVPACLEQKKPNRGFIESMYE
jgi:hypothetical protein